MALGGLRHRDDMMDVIDACRFLALRGDIDDETGEPAAGSEYLAEAYRGWGCRVP